MTFRRTVGVCIAILSIVRPLVALAQSSGPLDLNQASLEDLMSVATTGAILLHFKGPGPLTVGESGHLR